MKKCPFFGICGGCKFDFTAPDYHEKKLKLLSELPALTKEAFWTEPFSRRRADFAFSDGKFGFFQAHSKNIIVLDSCPLLCPQINAVLPSISRLPWNGTGSCLVTVCDNGIDLTITSPTPYFSTEFKNAVAKVDVIRASWNGKIVKQTTTPVISFAGHTVEYPAGAFLQPTVPSEDYIRNLVIEAAKGSKKVADLFCGLGNFSFALKADGFDICGYGVKRDLFKKPVTEGMLKQYDCVVMDPPRAGAMSQCKELIKSDVKKIIYISCNPETFKRDLEILTKKGSYKLTELQPIDQFIGSTHWELFSIFTK